MHEVDRQRLLGVGGRQGIGIDGVESHDRHPQRLAGHGRSRFSRADLLGVRRRARPRSDSENAQSTQEAPRQRHSRLIGRSSPA